MWYPSTNSWKLKKRTIKEQSSILNSLYMIQREGEIRDTITNERKTNYSYPCGYRHSFFCRCCVCWCTAHNLTVLFNLES